MTKMQLTKMQLRNREFPDKRTYSNYESRWTRKPRTVREFGQGTELLPAKRNDRTGRTRLNLLKPICSFGYQIKTVRLKETVFARRFNFDPFSVQ